jgi:hypothetical protein
MHYLPIGALSWPYCLPWRISILRIFINFDLSFSKSAEVPNFQ